MYLFSPKGCFSPWQWCCCPVRMREARGVTARTGSARCDRVCGACSGTACHFPQPPAQHLPTSMKLPLLEGERRKKERWDTLIIILCSSSCQVTHQAVVKHVRLPPSHHVIQFGGNRSGHVCQMTEQMWHLKICQLCPWTISEEKVNKTNPDLSIILIAIFGDYFSLNFCLQCDFSLSVFVQPQLWEFPHLQCQWWESKSKTTVWVTWAVTETLTPTPAGVFSVNLG